MNSKMIYKISPSNPEKEQIAQAAETIKNGGIVVLPTETRYGLCADIGNRKALDKLYEIKMRPKRMPSAIFLESAYQITDYAIETEAAKILAEKFLPGPLTLVLKNRSKYEAPIVEDGRIGIRISSCPLIAETLNLLDRPITATSANISGNDDCETIEQIFHIFGNKINLYLDSGDLNSLTSTVVECCDSETKILRQGAITSDKIEALLG